MSIQWLFVSIILYSEASIIALLLLPILSARRWYSVFQSNICSWIAASGGLYFTVIMAALIILGLDALREVFKYSKDDPSKLLTANYNDPRHMRLFRAQRNFYLTGFTLFLWYVLRRLICLTCEQGRLEITHEASLKQAKSASLAAQKLMGQNTKSEGKSGVGCHQMHQHSYKIPTFCDQCGSFLFGFFNQGLTCQACGFNCHEGCLEDVRKAVCPKAPPSKKGAEKVKTSNPEDSKAIREELVEVLKDYQNLQSELNSTNKEKDRLIEQQNSKNYDDLLQEHKKLKQRAAQLEQSS